MNTILLIYLFFGLAFTISVFTMDHSGPEMAKEAFATLAVMLLFTLFYPFVLLIRVANIIHLHQERKKRAAKRAELNRSASRGPRQ